MFPSEVIDAGEAVERDLEGARGLGDLEAEVAGLCGTINVATAALVDLIATVIEAGTWAGGGYRSIEHWVTVQCGLSGLRAKALCRLARRVDELPETISRFREGRMSEDQVAPIARHVPADCEASVAETAEHMTPSQVSRVVGSYHYDDNKPTDDPDGKADEDEERERAKRRSLSFGWDHDGNLKGSFLLPADQGAVVKQALEASRDILFNERSTAGDGDRLVEAQVTWADALVRLADIALGTDATNRPGSDRYEALVHLQVEDLDNKPASELAHLHLGPAIGPSMFRYLSCDASIRVILEKAGVAINEGRKYRTVPRKIRRAVENRDRGCRYPGCTNTRWVDVHHIVHVRHEASCDRGRVRGPPRWAVAAAW
jgi:hypothetical protein